jgi:hypothetical protein
LKQSLYIETPPRWEGAFLFLGFSIPLHLEDDADQILLATSVVL